MGAAFVLVIRKRESRSMTRRAFGPGIGVRMVTPRDGAPLGEVGTTGDGVLWLIDALDHGGRARGMTFAVIDA
jgi:hypothetical protein